MRPGALLRSAGLPSGRAERLSGGDTGDVWRVGSLVVKSHPHPPPGLFAAEARGLALLQGAGARVPAVRWVGEEGLVLDWIPPGPDDPEDLAAQVAMLHTTRADAYGADAPLYLGRFPLPSGRSTDWSALWQSHRIAPLLRATQDRLGPLAARVERAVTDFVPATEGPVLVHGDLWRGNVHMGAGGAALIDPCAREPHPRRGPHPPGGSRQLRRPPAGHAAALQHRPRPGRRGPDREQRRLRDAGGRCRQAPDAGPHPGGVGRRADLRGGPGRRRVVFRRQRRGPPSWSSTAPPTWRG